MMTSPPWHAALKALLDQHAHLPFARFAQAATMRRDGRPANRTLTFRFFLDDGRLLFTADGRTEKMAELAVNPWAELCWYFVEARVQMRLLGRMTVLPGDSAAWAEAREKTWRERSEEARQSFTWPAAGEPYAGPEAFGTPAPEAPPPVFALLAFAPEQVESLDLRCHPHRRERQILLADGAWKSAIINP